jgi:hypothetical protein
VKVQDPGHSYSLNLLDCRHDGHIETLTFVKRTGANYPGNDRAYCGTTMQEVLRCVADRLLYVQAQKPHKDNVAALDDIKEAIWHLECRAAERHNRPRPGFEEATYGECCPKCLHVGCTGGCH